MKTNKIIFAAALTLAVGIVGCDSPGVSGVTCEKDSDCNPGFHCNDHVCLSGGTNGSSGSSGGSTGTTGTCTVQCGPGQYCTPNASGGTCSNIYTLTITSPASGSFVDGGTQNAAVTLNAAGGRDGGLKRVEIVVGDPSGPGCSGTPKDLTGSGSTWTTTYQLASASDKAIRACAYAHDASDAGIGSATPVDLHLDVTPPTIALDLNGNPVTTIDPDNSNFGSAFIRDGDPVPYASSVDDHGGSGATVQVTIDGSALPANGSVDLQSLPLNGEHHRFVLQATATDRVGNVGAPKTQDVKVTRWKWIADTAVSSSLRAPAVGSDGTIYVANQNATQNVFSFAPDGSKRWSQSVPQPPSAPVAIGVSTASALFVLNGSQMSVLNTSDGSKVAADVSLQPSSGGGISAGATAPGFTLAQVPGGGDLAIVPTTYNKSGVEVLRVVGVTATAGVVASCPVSGAGSCDLVIDGTQVTAPFATGADVYFGGDAAQLLTLSASSGPSLTAAFNKKTLNEQISTGIVGSPTDFFFGGGVGTLQVGHVATSPGFNETPKPGATASNTVMGEPVVLGPSQALFGIHNSAGQLFEISGGAWVSPVRTLGGNTKGDTGLLLGSTSLYALSGSDVSVVDPSQQTSTTFGSFLWKANVSSVGAISAPPALTCARHGRSLLVIPTNSGKLIGFVVDEGNLNATAPWPKVRHDLFNSANASVNPTLSCP